MESYIWLSFTSLMLQNMQSQIKKISDGAFKTQDQNMSLNSLIVNDVMWNAMVDKDYVDIKPQSKFYFSSQDASKIRLHRDCVKRHPR